MAISYPRGTAAGIEITPAQFGPPLRADRHPGDTHVIARVATDVERDVWDSLVEGFPGWRVVHTRAWLESLNAAGLGRAVYIVFERRGRIVGCLPGLVASMGPLRLFGSPLPG